VITFLFLLLALTVLVFLIALWRSGLRAEVFRLTVVSVILFTANHLMQTSSAGTAALVCVTCAVIAALIVRQRVKHQATNHAVDADEDEDYQEDRFQPDTRYDSGGLADHVRQQQETGKDMT